jgi:hypothetical protein
LVDIAYTPWNYARWWKEGEMGYVSAANTVKSCAQTRWGMNAENLSNVSTA